jgi:hypothetical protein
MGNRVLIGNHATHGYGAYVSPSGVDVTAADNDSFLMDATAAGHAQALFWKEVSLASSATASTITYNNFGVRCYAIGTMSWAAGGVDPTSCISKGDGTVDTAARWSTWGGSMPTSNTTNGEEIGFKINNVDNGNGTGTITVTKDSNETVTNKPIRVQVMVFKEEV